MDIFRPLGVASVYKSIVAVFIISLSNGWQLLKVDQSIRGAFLLNRSQLCVYLSQLCR